MYNNIHFHSLRVTETSLTVSYGCHWCRWQRTMTQEWITLEFPKWERKFLILLHYKSHDEVCRSLFRILITPSLNPRKIVYQAKLIIKSISRNAKFSVWVHKWLRRDFISKCYIFRIKICKLYKVFYNELRPLI